MVDELAPTSLRKPYTFISYRRVDSAAHARDVYEAMQQAFGVTSVFMDVDSIRIGDQWPARLDEALRSATVLIAVIGQAWLGTQDRYKRRRIDAESDWVRNEISYALKNQLTVLPVMIQGAKLPDPAGLPDVLRNLAFHQAFELRDPYWDHDMDLLMTRLEQLGFGRVGERVRYPGGRRKKHPRELTPDEIHEALKRIPEWRLMTSPIPGKEPSKRTELSRSYEFASFDDAMEFMAAATRHISSVDHHPRWENLWRTVWVYLTTWDIGHKPSHYDVELAQYLDNLYGNYVRH